MPQASVIVAGNEKGGAVKSTIAIHTATALMHADAKVAVLDRDERQQSTAHFFAHRRAWLDANDATAPMPVDHPQSDGAVLAKAADEETLARTEARNRKRLDERVETLSRKVGFRIGPGLRDRVIYRELFPFGLTVADLSPQLRPVAMSLQHVAARQELRALMTALGLSGFSDGEQIAAD